MIPMHCHSLQWYRVKVTDASRTRNADNHERLLKRKSSANNTKIMIDDDPLMQLTVEEFTDCRITPSGLISVIDAIGHFLDCSRVAANKVWSRIYAIWFTSDIPVEFYQFTGAGQRLTPVVATLSVLRRILALVPGPKGAALRAARSIGGDRELEAVLPVRRAAMGTAGQALAGNGMASSANAQQKRHREVEEAHQPKHRKLEYTTEQLMEVSAEVCPGTRMLPIVIESFWEDTGHDMSAFMARCALMRELRNSQATFRAEEARKQASHASELSRTAALGDAVLANEKARGQHVRDAEEVKTNALVDLVLALARDKQ
jgi:hypothetical protein